MKILITGQAGFIGTHLSQKLSSGHEILGMDLLAKKSAQLRQEHFQLELFKGDINGDFLSQIKEVPDIIIHLAAETGIAGSLHHPDLYFQQNVQGTFNVLEQCRKYGVKHLIYASSSSVYSPQQSIMHEEALHDQQLSYYGTTKRMTELMVDNYTKQFGIKAIGLRFFTVYGSWTRPDMAAYKFMKAIQQKEAITLYNDGDISRDFTHISDIVQSIALMIPNFIKEDIGFHEIFNIGSGQPISVLKYAELIAKNLGKELIIQSAPLPINELKSTYSNTDKLARYVGYQAQCSIEKGIQEMTDWFKEYGDIY